MERKQRNPLWISDLASKIQKLWCLVEENCDVFVYDNYLGQRKLGIGEGPTYVIFYDTHLGPHNNI